MNPRLQLTMVDAEEQAPALPDGNGREVEVWRDITGADCAYGYTAKGWHWLHFPGLATFRFGPGSNEVAAIAAVTAREEAIRDSFRRAVLPLALQVLGLEVLHASAVIIAGGVVGLCARSHTGKSTIAYGLSQRGCPLWADDAVAFEPGGPRVRAIRLPFRTRLRPDAASWFLAGGEVAKDAAGALEGSDHNGQESVPLAGLCVLKRELDQSGDVLIDRLRPSFAFRAVLPHAYCFSLLDTERKRSMMKRYLALSAQVPVLEIRFRPGLERLPAMLDRIEEAVGGLLA